MRQMHAQPVSRLARDLAEAGFREQNIAWMEDYLDPIQPEKPELPAQAQRQNPEALDFKQRARLLEKLIYWLDQKDQELRRRAVKAAYAVYGPALASAPIFRARPYLGVWTKLTQAGLSLDQLLGAEGALALAANCWACNGGDCREDLLRAGTEQIEGAMKLCPDQGDPARIILNCLWLAKQRPKGLLKSIFGGGDGARTVVRSVQEGLISRLPDLVPNIAPPATKLADYIRKGGGGPLPVTIQHKHYTAQKLDPSGICSACFLAMEAAPELQSAFLVCTAANPVYTLRRTLDLAGEEKFEAKIPWLVEHADFQLALAGLAESYPNLSKRIAKQYPDLYEKAVKNSDYRAANKLLDIVRRVDPAWVDRIRLSNKAYVQRAAANGLCSGTGVNHTAGFLQFIQTGKGLEALLKQHPIGATNSWNYANSTINYASDYGTDEFMIRSLIVGGMTQAPYCFARLWEAAYKGLPKDSRNTGTLLDMLLREGLPANDALTMVMLVDRCSYNEVDKKRQAEEAAQWLLDQPEELLEQSLTGPAFVKMVAVQALAKKGDFEKILPLAGDSSKQVRMLVADIFAAHPTKEGPEAALKLLQAKKASQRETGLVIIGKLDQSAHLHGLFSQKYRPELEAALAKEKSDKLAFHLKKTLGIQEEGGDAAAPPALQGDPVTLTLKGGKKRKVQWVLDAVPTKLEEDRIAAVMVSCMNGVLSEARALAKPLEAKELADYTLQVFDLWLEQKAPSKQKWVMTFGTLFGGRAMVDALKRQINQWPQEARGAIACDGVMALALSPEPEALLLVDSMSRKFKFKQVKAAAGRALDYAAKELGLSPEELADRIVPDLGLDQRGRRTFDYGPRRFEVSLSPALELEVRTAEGKKLKTMPAPGKQDDPELAAESSAQFKALKKQIKATVATQTLRLEQALSTGRTWTGEGWRDLFVKKPVMRQFAVGLVWGVYEEDKLTSTFRYLEDGSLNTADEEEFTLPENARVGLVHPVELSPEDLSAWKGQLEDYEIRQPISQLDRPVYRLDAGAAQDTSLELFGGKVLNGLSLSGKLLSQGWFRGSVQDAGIYYDFYREDGGVGAQLNFSGMWVGGEDEEVEAWDVQFYRAGTVRRGSYVYDAPKDNRLIPLGQVAPRMYSEIVYQLKKATASSTETRDDWKSRK